MRHNAADDEVTRAHVRNRAALGRTPLRHQLRRSGSGPDERDYAAAGDQARPGDRAAVEIHTARGKTPLKRTGELLLELARWNIDRQWRAVPQEEVLGCASDSAARDMGGN